MARIAVIGAGMGAMATAARLAVAGHRVTVYERGSTYGGSVGRYERDGFAFDTGPGLLHLPAVYRDLFVKTGRKPLEECVELVQVDPAVRHLLPDGTSVTLPNASRGGAAAVLDEAFGAGSGDRWNGVLGRARDAWNATRRPLLEEPLRPDWQVLGTDPYPALRKSGLLRRRPPTLAEVAERELGGPLGELLTARVRAYGLRPADAPARRRCSRTWSRPSGAGTCAVGSGSWPRPCTSAAWSGRWTSSSTRTCGGRGARRPGRRPLAGRRERGGGGRRGLRGRSPGAGDPAGARCGPRPTGGAPRAVHAVPGP